ncbi:hypothetical protein ABZ612_34790 [Streptomyces avermitilis]|uniref:hypothetical protein n=1 Tax=Streptomyces avermitilis TaxID=33903 RepID=UPI0033F1D010
MRTISTSRLRVCAAQSTRRPAEALVCPDLPDFRVVEAGPSRRVHSSGRLALAVLFEGDDLGEWLERQKNPGAWAQLSTEQRDSGPPEGRSAPLDQVGRGSGSGCRALLV